MPAILLSEATGLTLKALAARLMEPEWNEEDLVRNCAETMENSARSIGDPFAPASDLDKATEKALRHLLIQEGVSNSNEVRLPYTLARDLIHFLVENDLQVPPSLRASMPGEALAALCSETETEPEEWEEIDGVGTGVGAERWYAHRSGKEAYVCVDQESSVVQLSLAGSHEYERMSA